MPSCWHTAHCNLSVNSKRTAPFKSSRTATCGWKDWKGRWSHSIDSIYHCKTSNKRRAAYTAYASIIVKIRTFATKLSVADKGRKCDATCSAHVGQMLAPAPPKAAALQKHKENAQGRPTQEINNKKARPQRTVFFGCAKAFYGLPTAMNLKLLGIVKCGTKQQCGPPAGIACRKSSTVHHYSCKQCTLKPAKYSSRVSPCCRRQ